MCEQCDYNKWATIQNLWNVKFTQETGILLTELVSTLWYRGKSIPKGPNSWQTVSDTKVTNSQTNRSANSATR